MMVSQAQAADELQLSNLFSKTLRCLGRSMGVHPHVATHGWCVIIWFVLRSRI